MTAYSSELRPVGPPPLPPSRWRRVKQALLTHVPQVAIGLGIALAAHVLAIAVTGAVAFLGGPLLVTFVIAEGSVLVATIVAMVVLALRARFREGTGLAIGWMAGSAGIALAVAAVVAVLVLAALLLASLMLVSFLLA